MKRIRELASHLGGSGWFVGLALALGETRQSWAPELARVAWVLALVWADEGSV